MLCAVSVACDDETEGLGTGAGGSGGADNVGGGGTTAATSSTTASSSSSSGGGSGVELAYDDGDFEEPGAPLENAVGGMFATRFTPPVLPTTLRTARFYITSDGTPTAAFAVRILSVGSDGNPGTDLLSTPLVAQATKGEAWVDVDFAPANISVSGDFFVAMEWQSAPGDTGDTTQFVGLDRTQPDGRSRIFFASTGQWYSFSEIGGIDRDAMVRVVVNP